MHVCSLNWMNDGLTKIPGGYAIHDPRRYVTYSLHGLGINDDFMDQETSDIVRSWHRADCPCRYDHSKDHHMHETAQISFI